MYMDTNLHLKSLWTTVYIIHSWLCHSLRLTDVPLGANLALYHLKEYNNTSTCSTAQNAKQNPLIYSSIEAVLLRVDYG